MSIMRKLSAILAHINMPGARRCCVCGRPAGNHYHPWGVHVCDEHLPRLVPVMALDTKLRLGRAPLVSRN